MYAFLFRDRKVGHNVWDRRAGTGRPGIIAITYDTIRLQKKLKYDTVRLFRSLSRCSRARNRFCYFTIYASPRGDIVFNGSKGLLLVRCQW